MRTTIVCGLLGSGKTTFIQNFLRDNNEKAVVLVNDFGKAGIDGEIFSMSGIDSIELPSGCVCCTLKTDLISTIEKIITTLAPEHLLIEPSGVASPSGVLEALEQLKITPVTVIGIVDATEFVDLHEAEIYGSFFRDQVANSDVVLINKTDLADEEKIRKTQVLIEEINPKAITSRSVQATLEVPVPAALTRPRSIQRHAPHLRFETGSFRLGDKAEFSSYESFFKAIRDGVFGDIVRAKSIVRTDRGEIRFDLSFGTMDVVPIGSFTGEGRLVIIGEHLEKEALSRALEDLAFFDL